MYLFVFVFVFCITIFFLIKIFYHVYLNFFLTLFLFSLNHKKTTHVNSEQIEKFYNSICSFTIFNNLHEKYYDVIIKTNDNVIFGYCINEQYINYLLKLNNISYATSYIFDNCVIQYNILETFEILMCLLLLFISICVTLFTLNKFLKL